MNKTNSAYQLLSLVERHEAETAFDILEKDGEVAVIDYLLKNKLNEQEPEDEPRLNGDEAVYEAGGLILAYNPHKKYISLQRRIKVKK